MSRRAGPALGWAGEVAARPLDLEWLLHPIAVDRFLDAHWESRPLHVARDEPAYFAGLPSLDDVDELITATTSGAARSADDGRLVRSHADGGRDQRPFRPAANGLPDVQDVYRSYGEGYSVVLNRLHRRSAPVAALCAALEVDLQHPVGANMYLTPRAGQGFPPHVDTHDVFILQLHGTKEWHVASGESDLPLARTKNGDVGRSMLDQCLTLRPGDVLYLPRGVAHEAVTSSSSSLHLTVGIHVFRVVDLLMEALATLAEERLPFRQALPRGFLDMPLDPQLPAIARELAEALAEDGVAERAKARLGARLRAEALAAQPGQFRAIDATPELCEQSVVARRPGVCRVRLTGDEAAIEFQTNYVAGPPGIEPALRFIAERERFSIGELPGALLPQDRVDLVGRLISEGLLYLP